jgi:protoporphyrin/coproporphyrin ferrochelatase
VSAPVGVLLMTFGSAVTSADVPAYLRSVYRGKDAPAELIEEFQRRYDLVGRSPLIDITQAQGAALAELLGPGHAVEVGMLHSEPTIAEAVGKLGAAGVRRLVGIVLAPQFSEIIMGGYGRALAAAAEQLGPDAEASLAGPWHDVPGFLDCLAELVRNALARRGDLPVIFTAHSLPKAVVDRDPAYLDQLQETIAQVVRRSGLAPDRWRFAWQSAGHTPEEWLTPDLKDLLPDLRAAGADGVLVVPIQFLADHLEILYDIDVAARDEAEQEGLAFHRIELPNTSPTFIDALRQVVEREVSPAAGGPPGSPRSPR